MKRFVLSVTLSLGRTEPASCFADPSACPKWSMRSVQGLSFASHCFWVSSETIWHAYSRTEAPLKRMNSVWLLFKANFKIKTALKTSSILFSADSVRCLLAPVPSSLAYSLMIWWHLAQSEQWRERSGPGELLLWWGKGATTQRASPRSGAAMGPRASEGRGCLKGAWC